MSYERLKKELKSNTIKNVYLLYGEEIHLTDLIVKTLKKKILNGNTSYMNLNVFRDDYDEKDVINAYNTIPMIGNIKMVICYDSGFFTSNKKRESIVSLLNDINDGSHIVFVEKKIDSKNNQFKAYKENQNAYNFRSREEVDIKKYIVSEFEKKKKKISKANLNLFITYSGIDLLNVMSDIEKISLCMGDEVLVKEEYIEKLCSGTREVKLYELTNATFNKNRHKALEILRELLSDKTPVQVILPTLHSAYTELYIAKCAMEKSKPFEIKRRGRAIKDSIKSIIMRTASKFSKKDLENIINSISRLDINIKTGKINGVVGVETLLIEIMK